MAERPDEIENYAQFDASGGNTDQPKDKELPSSTLSGNVKTFGSNNQTGMKSPSPSELERAKQLEITPQDVSNKHTDSGYLDQSLTVDLKTLLNPGLNPSIKLSASDERTLELYDSKETEEQDVLFQFFTHLSAMDPQTIQKLPTTVQYMEGSELRSQSISKKDLLHAIFIRCDKPLLQDVISKLQSIGLAIPIILPRVDSGRKIVLRHAIRKLFRHPFNPKIETREKIHLADFDSLCVSAMRIGDINFSKSELLNALLSKLTNVGGKHFFTSSGKDTPKSFWSNGTVEAVWYNSDQTNDEGDSPPFLLLNARGDGQKDADIQTAFACLSNVNILFVSDNITSGIIKQIISILKSESTVVLIYENIPPDQFPPEVILLKREKCSVNNIIDRLAIIINEEQNKSSRRCSASDFEILFRIGGMESDEGILEKIKKEEDTFNSAIISSSEIQSGSLGSANNLAGNIYSSETDANIKSVTKKGNTPFDTTLYRKMEGSDTFEKKKEQVGNLRGRDMSNTDEVQRRDKKGWEEQYKTRVIPCDQSNDSSSADNIRKKSNTSEPDANVDDVVETEIKSFNTGLKRKMEDSNTLVQKKETVEAYSIHYLAEISRRHRSRRLHEVKYWAKDVITDELKKVKYGPAVNEFVAKGFQGNLHNLTEPVVSMEDVRRVEKQFNNVIPKDEEILSNCEIQLDKLSCEYTTFESSAQNMIHIIKGNLKEFSSSVNKPTIGIFLCIKFIFKIHRQHVIVDLLKADKNASQQILDFESYVIKYEEPLKFKSIDKKLEWIIHLLKSAFTDDIFAQMAYHITSYNATNYLCIPFSMQALQKLDINFLKFLPVVSSNNMDHILRAVNDSKSYVLGKILGQAPFNFDELFNHIFKLIKTICTDSPKSEQIKASAYVHVFAWSCSLISVKIHQNENENSILYLFEKQLPILTLNFEIYTNKELQDYFSDKVHKAVMETLLKNIPQDLENELRRSFLHDDSIFTYKQLFIKYMLNSFCQREDYLSILSFVESYENCSVKWILPFLAKIINCNEVSKIETLKLKVIQRNVNILIDGVRQVTEICVKDKDETLYSWTKLFQKYLSKNNCKIFQHLDKQLKFDNIMSFCKQLCASFKKLETILRGKIELPPHGNLDATKTWLYSFPNNMCDEMSRNILGCRKQCPVCGNVCEYSLVFHTFHSNACHIPIGIKGRTENGRRKRLSSLTCTNLVSRANVVTPLEVERDDKKSFSSLVQELPADWDISPHKSHECKGSLFWKYVFNRFNRQFSDFYECEKGKVPSEWREISEKEAMESLEGLYGATGKESESS